MSSLASLLAPLALLLPLPAGDTMQDDAGRLTAEQMPGLQVSAADAPGWLSVESLQKSAIYQQIRIERRLTIRIAPRAPTPRQSIVADVQAAQSSGQLVERKFGKCVSANAIAGVQPAGDSRLILFMRDQRVITADLEKACSAQDFYSGFYIEQSKDGMLCVDRDKLHSRTGADCEVERMRQLVSD